MSQLLSLRSFVNYCWVLLPIILLLPPSVSKGQKCLPITHNPFTNFNNSKPVGIATTLWLNVHTKLSKQLSAHGDYLSFTGGNINLIGISASWTSAFVPDGKIIADSTIVLPTTSFDIPSNTWITKVPLNYSSSDIFISAAVITSTTGYTVGSGKQSQVSGNFYSNKAFSSSWFYGIAAYQPTFTYNDIAAAGTVTSIGGGAKAGTPTTMRDRLVPGGTGGGGSNYTGSYSSTDSYTTCSNNCLTDGGQITGEESQCNAFFPKPLLNAASPTGGTGTIEYMWLSSTTGCPTDISQAIRGENGESYLPTTVLTQTTWFARWSKNVNCPDWTVSNCVKKEVRFGCSPIRPMCNAAIVTTSPNTIELSNITSSKFEIRILNDSLREVFYCANTCQANTVVIHNLPVGYYIIHIRYFSATGITECYTIKDATITQELGQVANAVSKQVLHLNARQELTKVAVQWVNSGQNAADYFIVERATEGVDFNAIETIKADNTQPSLQSYTIMDKTPEEGNNFYRIKLVEKSGVVRYSPIQAVFFKNMVSFATFPNPVLDEVNLNLEKYIGQDVTISVQNLLGNELYRTNIKNLATAIHRIDLSPYSSNSTFIISVKSPKTRLIAKKVMRL